MRGTLALAGSKNTKRFGSAVANVPVHGVAYTLRDKEAKGSYSERNHRAFVHMILPE